MKKIAVLSATIAAALSAHGADKITYDDHVLPIFRNACLNCHNPDKKKAGLDLSTYQATLQGSENGKVVQSGNAGASLLFKCVKGTEEPKMPPKGDMLNESELAVMEKWINGQLLENATGKAIAVANNNVQVAVVSLERPAGPPPMPGELPIEPYVRTQSRNAVTALAASPWAPVVAVGGQKQVLLYNTDTLAPLGVLPFPEGFPTVVRFSRNGQLLLTGGGLGGKSGKVALWDIKTGDRVATIGNEFDQVLGADISADQQFIALGGPTKLLKIYSTKDGKLLHSVKKHTDWITAVVFSPDGKYLASADRSGGIQIWEGATGKEFNTLAGHKAMVTGLAFMPGVLASTSEEGKIALWDAKEGKLIRDWVAHPGGGAWVDFTPDGRIVSCGRDKIAKVWDQNGKQIGKSEPLADIALRAVVSNDRLIAGDWSGRILVTSLEGKTLGELTTNPPTIADRVAATNKSLTDAQTAQPVLQQQFAAAENKLKAERLAADEARKKVIANAEQSRTAAQQALDGLKAAVPQAEKRVAELKGSVAALQGAREAAGKAFEAAQKAAADKQAANAPEAELKAAQADVPVKKTASDEAQKQLDARKAEIAKAEADLGKLRGEQPAKIAAADKALQQATAALAEANKPAAPVAAVTAAEQEVAKLKAAIDANNAQLAAAKADLERWKVAQVFQNAHNARRALADKEAQYTQLVQAVKDAPQAIEKAQSDLASAKKIATEGPAKVQEAEKAFAAARQAVDAAKQAVAAAEKAKPEKDAAAKAAADNAPPVGDVPGVTKKLAEQNAELAKLRDARGAFPAESPEWKAANEKYQGFKAEVAKTQAALTAASAKNLEAPEVKAAKAEAEKATEALDAARQALKAAVQKSGDAEKTLATTRKTVTEATELTARLEKEMPQIVKNAENQKVQAEQAAAAAAKEVEAAKANAEKSKAEYEALKNGGAKAASLNVAPNKS